MRRLGLDYGEKRIGVAVSDADGTIAFALEVLPAGAAALPRLAALCHERAIGEVIVGLPRHMNGDEGEAAQKARAFAGRLRTAVSCPVILWDERLTTVMARNALLEGGVRREKRRGVVDKIAAQILLQHYLDSQAPTPDPDRGDPCG